MRNACISESGPYSRMQITNKRNSELEIIRFLFCVLVVWQHSDLFSPFQINGRYAVGFFFILSGFFIPQFPKNESAWRATVVYLWRQIKKIYPIFFLSAVMGAGAWYLTRLIRAPLWWGAWHALPELCWIQMFCRCPNGWWVTGVAWFLGAWIAGLGLLSFIYYKFPKAVQTWLVPLIWVGSWIWIGASGIFSDPGEMWIGPLHRGVLLGVAGAAFGGVLRNIYEKIKNYPGRTYCWLRWPVFSLAILLMFTDSSGCLIWLLSGIGILLCVWKEYSGKASAKNWAWAYFLGQWSAVLYLNHFYWALALGRKFAFFSLPVKYSLYLGLSLGTSLFVWWLAKRLIPYGYQFFRANVMRFVDESGIHHS